MEDEALQMVGSVSQSWWFIISRVARDLIFRFMLQDEHVCAKSVRTLPTVSFGNGWLVSSIGNQESQGLHTIVAAGTMEGLIAPTHVHIV